MRREASRPLFLLLVVADAANAHTRLSLQLGSDSTADRNEVEATLRVAGA